MVELLQRVVAFLKNFWPLFVVLPWESAVRARAGKHVALLGPGIHFRLPFFDLISLVNTRMRFVHSDLQTLSTKDGAVLTASFTVGFRIVDPLTATMRLHKPERAVTAMVCGFFAEVAATHTRSELTPEIASRHVLGRLRTEAAGYEFEICQAGDFGYMRTFRLMQQYGSAGWTEVEERAV